MQTMTATPPAPAQGRIAPVAAVDFPPEQAALMFDFDGTLVDIAPTPDSVVVPPGLLETLLTLRERSGGALAIITGRPIEQVDHFLPGIPTAVAGEHGIALRRTPAGDVERRQLPEVPATWLSDAEALVGAHPGAAVERKRAGFVLHYRQAPEAEQSLHKAVSGWIEGHDGFELQAAKMAWEVRPAGVNKGHAVMALLEQSPFKGRKPIFVGDDRTDLDGVEAARAAGGAGFLIPDDFPTAQDFRDWLAHYAETR